MSSVQRITPVVIRAKKTRSHTSLSTFLSHFNFQPKLAGALGLEHEAFLLDTGGSIVPFSPDFLLDMDEEWGEELSACQVEFHPRPAKNIPELISLFERGLAEGRARAREIGLRLATMEIAPDTMPYDVYPSDRYRGIAASIKREQLVAACRVAATQLHFGVGSIGDAIALHNRVVSRMDEFVVASDNSDGLRLETYKVMATNWEPPIYESVEDFFETAVLEGFVNDPRSCYHLVRISRFGSIELRMLGATEDSSKVRKWAEILTECAQECL